MGQLSNLAIRQELEHLSLLEDVRPSKRNNTKMLNFEDTILPLDVFDIKNENKKQTNKHKKIKKQQARPLVINTGLGSYLI